MIEVLEELDASAALAHAVQQRRAADTAEAQLLRLAAHWADLHPVLAEDDLADGTRVPGTERLMPLAGPGTPDVAEFASAELAAALGLSTFGGQQLVGDALELRHRLPRLWARVTRGDLQAWRARQIAQRTRCLPPDGAAWVDAQVAGFAHKLGLGRVLALVEAAVLRFDPATAAKNAKAAAEQRGVWLGDTTTTGTRTVHIEADALDAGAFDATITDIASALARLGDTDLTDTRRAKAIGVIANPQGTLDLLTTPTGDGVGTGAGQPGKGAPRVVLYLHLHQAAVQTRAGTPSGTGCPDRDRPAQTPVGRAEGLGAVTVEQIRDWVGHSHVTVKPVLDLQDRASVDAYETPHRMREALLLRNPCCPFPWCDNLTRNKDTDHITPYQDPAHGGPPGQTNPDNLAPLCRRHHRLKTFAGWRYTMPEPGLYLWRSPHGRRYLVDHSGTTTLPHRGDNTS